MRLMRRSRSGGTCTAIGGDAPTRNLTSGRASLCVGLPLLLVMLALTSSALGSGPPVTSSSAVVGTFGKTSVGGSSDSFAPNRKRVSAYALPVAGSVTKLSIYLAPGGASGKQVLEGVLYADSSGKPGALLGVSSPLTFMSTNAAGWYDLTFAAALNLPAGTYWMGVITGAGANVAGFRYDSVSGSRQYNSNTYTSGPTNPFGATTTDSEQASLYATYTGSAPPPPPVNSEPPAITGTPRDGQTLSAGTGTWSENPTAFGYQWERCDSTGANCAAIPAATGPSYLLGHGDVGSTVRVAVSATNAGGSSAPTLSAQTPVVEPLAPSNTVTPAISGAAQVEQTLSAAAGTWAGTPPLSYTYEWLRCDSTGANCLPISLAGGQTYTTVSADVGSTLRVAVTASNSAGTSSPAVSAQTAVVQQGSATFGKTGVGASSDAFAQDRKRVSSYSLPVAGSVTKLSIYLAPTGTSGQQVLKGVIYADSSGKPAALLGVSEQLTFSSTNSAGWYDLVFPSPVKLAAGNYWIGVITGSSGNVAGFRYDSVAGSRQYNSNTYTSGPTNPFGATTTDSEQASLYATYTSEGIRPTRPPGNLSAPTISGIAQVGRTLTASPGEWSGAPTSFGYQWLRCDGSGANCSPVESGNGPSYTDVAADLGATLRVQVVATNAAGPSSPASSAQTAVVVAATGVQHYEYVFPANAIDVYDMDNGQKLVKTISLPPAATDIRGAAVSPATHMLYVSYGGDGGSRGGGSMLEYDLVNEKIVWTHSYTEGVDSMAVSPDGKTIYLPVGEESSAGNWNVVEASSGNIIGKIEGGRGPHNTIVSLNGDHVYMGGRTASFLSEAETQNGHVIKQIGPLLNGGVRPFTINGSETLAFTTATGYLGFQVSSITTGKVLYTVPVSGGFPYTPGQAGPSTPSHGISLSPDEKEVWVVDQPNSYVHVFDITGLPSSPPKQIANIRLTREMTGTQAGCTYDCLREGWLQHSLDGRFVYVGDSGDVIDTSTRQSVANLQPLYNSRVFLEVDWSNGVPVATSTRSGLGYVVK